MPSATSLLEVSLHSIHNRTLLIFPTPPTERGKEHFFSNGQSDVMGRLPLVRCGSLSLYCGQGMQGFGGQVQVVCAELEKPKICGEKKMIYYPKRKSAKKEIDARSDSFCVLYLLSNFFYPKIK